MKHVQNALIIYNGGVSSEDRPETKYIKIDNIEDVKGVPPVVSFTIQSDPVGEVGVNGCQASDMLEYVKCLFQSLNNSYPCRENALTITKIEEALHWQDARTKNRIKRNVEGKSAL